MRTGSARSSYLYQPVCQIIGRRICMITLSSRKMAAAYGI